MSDILIRLVLYLGTSILPYTFPIGWIMLFINYFILIRVLRQKNAERLSYIIYKTQNQNIGGKINSVVGYGYMLGALSPRVLKYYWNKQDKNIKTLRVLKFTGKVASFLMIGIFAIIVAIGLITFIVIEFE